jgi:signal transduction histidine kinase
MARSHVHRLSEMIAQLLDLGRLESGQMPIDAAPGELVALARSVQHSLVPLAGIRNCRLTGSAAVHAFYDAPLVARVLANLLINAFKFTPERAEVTVDLRDEGDFSRVTVADRGPGIPAEFHGRIFEKFGQVESRKGPRGFGIGLAFCRLAVEAHGGAIGVHSEVGGGSSFWFTLPTSPPPPSPTVERRTLSVGRWTSDVGR